MTRRLLSIAALVAALLLPASAAAAKRERVLVGRQVFHELPGRVLVLGVLRDADDVAGHVAGAVELGMRVGDRHRRRPVVELRVLVGKKRRA